MKEGPYGGSKFILLLMREGTYELGSPPELVKFCNYGAKGGQTIEGAIGGAGWVTQVEKNGSQRMAREAWRGPDELSSSQ